MELAASRMLKENIDGQNDSWAIVHASAFP